MAIEQFTNLAITTLNTGVDALLTTVTVIVNDASRFPTVGQFRIRLDNEFMLVTGVSGTSFTVVRAIEGSTAASHLPGIAVSQVLTAGVMSAFCQTIVATQADIDLTTTANTVIDTRPATPTGPGRWKLVSIDLRLKVAITGGGTPSSIVSIGSTSGGQEVVLNQTVLPATSVGTIVGGFSLSSLGANMSQITGFESIYPASQEIWANVTASGPPATGTLTAYLLWQGFP
jgi:hypothetical protein